MQAARLVDEANTKDAPDPPWKRFGDTSQIKAEVRTWLAWQREPGAQLGAAINDRILGSDSPQAISFSRWIKTLFELNQLQIP